jgi:hypothetical protein
MGELWNRIAGAIARLHRKRQPVQNRRQAPRFICCCAVTWEAGAERGEGELREVSATGMRLRTDQALLAGQHIRIRPATAGAEQPLPLDVAVGTVIYSKSRRGKVEVGVELIHPERISRFAWFHQLRRDPETVGSPLPSVLPRSGGLHIVESQPKQPRRPECS